MLKKETIRLFNNYFLYRRIVCTESWQIDLEFQHFIKIVNNWSEEIIKCLRKQNTWRKWYSNMHVFRFKKLCKPGFCILQTKYWIIFTIAFANVSSSDTWILAITQSSIRHENRLGNSDAGKISVFSTSGNTAICKQKDNYNIRQLDNSMPNKIYKYLLNQIYQYSLKCESQIGENIINKLLTMHTHHFNCSSLIKHI